MTVSVARALGVVRDRLLLAISALERGDTMEAADHIDEAATEVRAELNRKEEAAA